MAPLLLAGIVTTQAVASAAGVSARTINRHLAASGTPRVAAAVLTDTELDSMVAKQIDKLGSNYGARMVIGALRAAHPQSTFSRKRVVASMARHDPMAHAARRIWAQKRIERGAYHAPNFMHSVHLDLACKLQQYNLYVAAMIDGDSRMCLALRAIRTKIPFVIYMTVFLPCVLAFGCPDQLVTDKGPEWDIAAFVQLAMQELFFPQRPRSAHKYTTSTRNVSRRRRRCRLTSPPVPATPTTPRPP